MDLNDFYEYMLKAKEFETPESLNKFCIDTLKYSWCDEKFYKYNITRREDPKLFYERYRMLKPNEVFQYKAGICWDQAIFINYISQFRFIENKPKIFLMMRQDDSTHLFNTLEIKKKILVLDHMCPDEENRFRTFPSYGNMAESMKNNYNEMIQVSCQQANLLCWLSRSELTVDRVLKVMGFVSEESRQYNEKLLRFKISFNTNLVRNNF